MRLWDTYYYHTYDIDDGTSTRYNAFFSAWLHQPALLSLSYDHDDGGDDYDWGDNDEDDDGTDGVELALGFAYYIMLSTLLDNTVAIIINKTAIQNCLVGLTRPLLINVVIISIANGHTNEA